eukprot:5603314-Alexandrium_andersonii.AAC.1
MSGELLAAWARDIRGCVAQPQQLRGERLHANNHAPPPIRIRHNNQSNHQLREAMSRRDRHRIKKVGPQ